MKKEVWIPVLGYEGLYEVSNLGRVKSLKYCKEKVLKPGKDGRGYLRVLLYKNDKKKYSIHRLVYEAFHGKIPEDMQVNHINEDKTDNRLENLNLMTAKENCNWGTRNKRTGEKIKGEKHPWIIEKLSEPVVQIYPDGTTVIWSSMMEAQRNGFHAGHISDCCSGKRKRHKGCQWTTNINIYNFNFG